MSFNVAVGQNSQLPSNICRKILTSSWRERMLGGNKEPNRTGTAMETAILNSSMHGPTIAGELIASGPSQMLKAGHGDGRKRYVEYLLTTIKTCLVLTPLGVLPLLGARGTPCFSGDEL